ncbi:MAG: OFA family MFS transporter [Candidatus Eisenbacteria bacterium]|uniref:OFA family MFS transporter n=1 Tax=Eiseniibacteriota bacterium TaxID=2212470 RepID=A0A937X9B3_UNCEI|nr:OFA family MFS transporter [Candidatus Eisenbacteria bacterium]
MDREKVMNRWWVVVGALIIQVSLGAVYIWSVFQTPLKAVFPTWSEGNVTLPAQIVLAAFAAAVIFGGRLQDKLGPRIVATAGGIILGLGLILARFTGGFGPDGALVWLVFTFSLLGGIGIGVAYVCPIATCVKWFPDKRGLITGLAVAGFGAGAFFFAPLAKALIAGGQYQLLGADLFGLPKLGVFNTFMTLGILFLVAIVLGAQFLRNPPAGYVPAGWTPPAPRAGAPAKADFTPGEMLRTGRFWLLWITYFAGCTAGLQVIMKASPVWQSFAIGELAPPIDAASFNAISAAGAMAVSILAIFNSLGRILWGKISDIIGRKPTLFVMFLLCGVAMLFLDSMRGYGLYLTGIGVVGLCFGGYLALYPAVTADFYGTRHYGVNYGWMFSAYGAGGLFGPFLAAWLMRVASKVPYEVVEAGQTLQKTFAVGNYRLAFVVAGVMCLAAALAVQFVRAPKQS